MSTDHEIALKPRNQRVRNVLIGSKRYNLRVVYCASQDDQAGWVVDVLDTLDNPLACGIPLVPGEDLLAAVPELGIDATLTVVVDPTDGGEYPSFAGLGTTSHLIATY